MRAFILPLVVLAASFHGLVAAAPPNVSFASLEEDEERIFSATVALDGNRLASIAVVGADPSKAVTGDAEGVEELELIVHDPVSRLTILKLPEGSPAATVMRRGTALDLGPGDEVFLDPAKKDEPSRVVKWETKHRGKVLPLALIRIHHPGAEAPLAGTPLYDAEGALVAICHQAAPEFGNGTYALPVEVVERTEEDHRARGKVARCWIGITLEAKHPVPAVEMVRPDSPAKRAGIQKGDILLEVGQHPVRTYADAVNAFYYLVSGKAVAVRLLRGTELLSVEVVPEVHPVINAETGQEE